MTINISQDFKRTSKSLRFEDDVMTKEAMLSWTDDKYSDWYLVVESESHDLYIYDSSATPSSETWKFVKVETWSGNAKFDITPEHNIASTYANGEHLIFDFSSTDTLTARASIPGFWEKEKIVATKEYVDSKVVWWSVPDWWTTWQALVKKSNTNWDVEWKTVQGLTNTIDMSFTQRSEEWETWTDSVTIKKDNNSYLEIKQNSENGNLLDIYTTNNTVDVPHTLVSKYYADYHAWKIATIKVNWTEQTVNSRTVDIKTPEFNVNVNEWEVNEATIINKANWQVKEIISFSKSLVDENCIQIHAETDNMSDTPIDTHLTSKTYVDNAISSIPSATVDQTYDATSINAQSWVAIAQGILWTCWDLTALTTDNTNSLVEAINEVYEKSWEPFRVKNWASNSLNVSIEPCTTDKSNWELAKMTFSIDNVEWADYQIVGMIAYEVFDAVSGWNRLNVWPVCQFTWNWQKELSVRWVCAWSTTKTAKRINAWVLLKHR